jgi:serine/threonine protein kinase/Tol biopolymer transport system component
MRVMASRRPVRSNRQGRWPPACSLVRRSTPHGIIRNLSVSLQPGRRLGPYEIIAPLGAGGMGEVYRARDIRLHRNVAIKILPNDVAGDPDRRQRFEREAQAVARLEHPHIASVYDVGVHDATLYIVSEFVDGTTLRARLERGPLSAAKALAIGAQVADGLAAAHERGIVHRDIKPDNIIIRADETVKVIDFGVAKMDVELSAQTIADTKPATVPGMIVGTSSYMSPEQVRGEALDHRTDVFSLGAVLFEMATGNRAFGGLTGPETMASVLRDDPRSPDEQSALPAGLSAIIMRCLDKRPSHRFQSARDLAFALQTLPRSTGRAIAQQPAAPSKKSIWVGVTLAALALVAVAFAIAGGLSAWRPGTDGASLSAAVRQLTFDSGVEAFPNLSSDGSMVVYAGSSSGNFDIYLRDVGAREAINLTSDSPVNDSQPALSRDGQQIAFRSERDGGGIFAMGRTGGVPRRIARSGFNPTWSPDGKRIATATESTDWRPGTRSAAESVLSVTDVVTGETRALPTGDAVQPAWSPNGHRIAYWGLWQRNQRDVWTISPDGAAPVRVTSDAALDWSPTWSADGRWLYFASDRGGSVNLWRIAIDEVSGQPHGAPEPMTLPASWVGHPSAGAQGAIAFTSFQRSSNLDRVPFDPERGVFTGPAEAVTSGSNSFAGPQVSKDGRLLAFLGEAGTGRNVFVSESDGRRIRSVTTGPHRESGVSWNATSDKFVFYSSRPGRYQIFSVNVDGSELKQLTDIPDKSLGRALWSDDGRWIATLEAVTQKAGLIDLAKVPATTMEPLPPLPDGSEFSPTEWARDGSRLLGESTKGALVVYSIKDRTYRTLAPRSNGGPRWLPDGNRVLFALAGEFFILNEVTGTIAKVGRAPAPPNGRTDGANLGWTLSWDGRWLYRSLTFVESDLWLMTRQ